MESPPWSEGLTALGCCRAVSERRNVRSKMPATGERTPLRPGLEQAPEGSGRRRPPLASARRRGRGWSDRPEFPVEAARRLRAHPTAVGSAKPVEAFGSAGMARVAAEGRWMRGLILVGTAALTPLALATTTVATIRTANNAAWSAALARFEVQKK